MTNSTRAIAVGLGLTLLLALVSNPDRAVAKGDAAGRQSVDRSYGGTGSGASGRVRDASVLPSGWKNGSDQVVRLVGDADGLSVLAARESEAYQWRMLAKLSRPGIGADKWVGNSCVTSSGRYLIVVYAPSRWQNSPSLYLRGAFAAVVDLQNGGSRDLPVTGSMAYFDPGCGVDDQAVITQTRLPEESGKSTATRLYVVDAKTASAKLQPQLEGQVSGATPSADSIVAIRGKRIVEVRRSGAVQALTRAPDGAAPFDLHLLPTGDLAFLAGTEQRNAAYTVSMSAEKGRTVRIARETGSWMDLQSGARNSLFLVGEQAHRGLPPGVSGINGSVGDAVSTTGAAVVEHETRPSPRTSTKAWRRSLREGADSVGTGDSGDSAETLKVRFVATDKTASFDLAQARKARDNTQEHQEPSLTARSVPGASDPNATCAVPRNDPDSQVYQPTPRQVEWAVDQAVVDNLQTARPANFHESGLPSWTPQKMFPSIPLHGGGRVPAQVLLGILAQESNLWQASYHALPGEFGNPLVGNYYGRSGTWDISFRDADCGYGLGQVTDGMRKGADSATHQRAIALDYETNIARALQILETKWNQVYDAGLLQDNGSPEYLENWIFAIWAYNSGFYADESDGTPWGVGWFNNPANPIYPANRTFFNEDPHDPAHPADWPYEEKVFGFAAYSIAKTDGPGFRPSWWISDKDRYNAKPPVYAFCDSSNNCSQQADGCPAVNSSCWWHKPVTYHDCAHGYCGHELKRFNTTYPEQPDGTNYPPACTLGGLPSGVRIVDDVPASSGAPRSGCGHPFSDAGSFSFAAASSARVDLHQLAGGFAGHFWFAHTRAAGQEGGRLKLTGTWSFADPLHAWGRVLVHLPDHGAETQQAGYTIHRGDGTSETRYTPQRIQANGWRSLGVFDFNGRPSVSLSTETYDGTGEEDVAFDAVAIQPLSKKPQDIVVAMGDSYASGEGANDPAGGDDYYDETDFGGEYGKGDHRRNACHRSPWSWSRRMTLAGSGTPVGERADSYDTSMDYHLVACSGAESENLLPFRTATGAAPTNAFGEHGTGQYGELSQLDQGYLDEATSLVTLSVGGNDALFGPVITDCATSVVHDCLQKNDSGAGPNETAIPARIRGKVKPSIAVVIQQIHERAPNAKILLMGYPQLISALTCSGAGAIEGTEQQWINDMSLVMDNAIADLVADDQQRGIPIAVGAPIGDFRGKGVCGDPEGIKGVLLADRTDGDLPVSQSPASQQSFHPTIEGTALYAHAAQRALKELGD